MRSAKPASFRLRLLRLAGPLLTAVARRTVDDRSTARNVLLLRPDHIGDVLLTAPAVDLLRTRLPDAQLTYLVGPWSVAAARNGPAVDRVEMLHYPGFTRRRKASLVEPYSLLAMAARRLRAEQYDAAVVFRPDHWWGALLALAAGIPIRIGGSTAETRPLLTHALPPLAATQHATDRALDLARLALSAMNVTLGPPAEARTAVVFAVPLAAHAEADRIWQQHRLTDRTVIVLQPTAGMPLKSWPLTRWARLARALLTTGHAVVLLGAPDDKPYLAGLAAQLGSSVDVPILAGQSLEVSAALFARAQVLVGPDSGAAHLAAAVGTPTVRLYGPAPPAVFGPWPTRPDQHVLLTEALTCVPCGCLDAPPCGADWLPACMLALDVTDVQEAVEQILAQG